MHPDECRCDRCLERTYEVRRSTLTEEGQRVMDDLVAFYGKGWPYPLADGRRA